MERVFWLGRRMRGAQQNAGARFAAAGSRPAVKAGKKTDKDGRYGQ
jgi:hypothetical protein